ncbi:dynein heavy chain, putative [Bodo saltans]|uniref:Dynein heavy chain, putative n=1 Tax=Bodo saltans TaxID=75058 RepID=A0A0S4J0Y0_BODSA|nr:dynein heavy chain, putative [Bodo saltans]|eukprot:CUG51588.1 dynein heavy chain, putative [Bodo saltans]
MSKGDKKDEEPLDRRLVWLEQRYNTALRMKAVEAKKFLENEENRQCLLEFVDVAERRSVFIVGSASGGFVAISSEGDASQRFAVDFRKKVFYFMKHKKEKLVDDKLFSRQLVFGDLQPDILCGIHNITSKVLLPMLHVKENLAKMPDVCYPELMESTHRVVADALVAYGKSEERTLLPIPPIRLPSSKELRETPAEQIPRELVHELEATVTDWSTSVRAALDTKPESLEKFLKRWVSPVDEIEFWKTKKANLSQLCAQLSQPFMVKIEAVLRRSGSSYYAGFASLFGQLASGLQEADEICRFLVPLEDILQSLNCQSSNHLPMEKWDEENVFRDLFHLLFQVWSRSTHYSTIPRMVNFIASICNDIILSAKESIDIANIFTGEFNESIQRLMGVLRCCAQFKKKYFDYKAKSTKELQRPWRFQNTALFRRLDLFLERVHDILDIVETAALFYRLSYARVGGTKSVEWSTELEGMYTTFASEYAKWAELTFDCLDIDDGRFDQVYEVFRSVVLGLERRLAIMLHSGLEDNANSIVQFFKTAETFDGFTDRPTARQEWVSQQPGVLKLWKKELLQLQDIFARHKDHPSDALPNTPPAAAAMIWGRALLGRLQASYQRTQSLEAAVVQCELGQECSALHDHIKSIITKFIDGVHEQWSASAGQLSTEKLHTPLVVVDAEGHYVVNFDPLLVRTLKESLYLERLNADEEDTHYTMPAQVAALHKSREQVRFQLLKLDYVCKTVRSLRTTLDASESALFSAELRDILQKLRSAEHDLHWSASDVVDEYILDLCAAVQALESVVGVFKSRIEEVHRTLLEISTEDKFLPLSHSTTTSGGGGGGGGAGRGSEVKVLTEAEFRKRFAEYVATKAQRFQAVDVLLKEGVAAALAAANDLRRLNGRAVVNPLSDEWESYLKYITGAVEGSLYKSLASSTQQLIKQLDHAWITANHGIPLLDVKLILTNPSKQHHNDDAVSIVFEPQLLVAVVPPQSPLEKSVKHGKKYDATPHHTIESVITTALVSLLSVAEHVTQPSTGFSTTYGDVVKARQDIVQLKDKVQALVDQNAEDCSSFAQTYTSYCFLFEESFQQRFPSFLVEEREAYAAQKQTRTAALSPLSPEGTTTSADPSSPAAPVPSAADNSETFFDGVPLAAYDAKARYYQSLADEFEDRPITAALGFCKVDAKPVRMSLVELCTQWQQGYLGHITHRMKKDLTELYRFVKDADAALDTEVAEGDQEALMNIMKWMRSCKVKNDEVAAMLPPFQEALAMLKHHPKIVGEALLEELEELRKPAGEIWGTLYRKSLNMRERYNSVQDREAERIKDDIAAFELRIVDTQRELRQSDLFSYRLDRTLAYRRLDGWGDRFHRLENESVTYGELETLFELARSDFKELRESRHELFLAKQVWDLVNHVNLSFEDWMTSTFVDVDVEGFLDEIRRMVKQLKGQPMQAKQWQLYKGLEDEVANMNKSLPLCAELRTPAMRPRHWDELLALSGGTSGTKSIDPTSATFTLAKLVGLGIHHHAEEISNIVEKAQKELNIERVLNKIVDAWSKIFFEYDTNKDFNIQLLCPVDAIIEQLEADTNALQAMLSDRFVDFFLERVQLWQRNVGLIDLCMNKWSEIQRKWLNLFPIFVRSADIREQLPEDAKKFEGADYYFRKLMGAASKRSLVTEILCTSAIMDDLQLPDQTLESYLQEIEDILLGCEKALTDYLETKRKLFPRFYFVSSADLVDILSKGSDPRAVMVHMSKIVDSIETFTLDNHPSGVDTPKTAWEMISIQNEHVPLAMDCKCDGPVEQWLEGCIGAMQRAMRMHIMEANASYIDKPRTEWIYQHPCQAIVVASRGWFTSECQAAFQLMEEGSDSGMKDFLKQQRAQLDSLIKEVLLDRTSEQRKMLVHLITIDVHNRDIAQQLVDDKIDSVDSFAWQSQLRYYIDEKRGSEIRIADAEFVNMYEYVGLCGCLVITKLTDRCYITLSQALRLKKGGAPAGPAGTGKTETTKDLARNLGIACYVFNCSDQMNYITLGQIFKGLAMSGSWGCFDEFNRISIEVLSVVATQVGSILNALKTNKTRFRFMDEEIGVSRSVGMFITMNPGYAGRTELPENIKSLFRPCAMCVPDLKNICEIMLAAEGFIEAKDLSLKFVTLYRLNKELLSPSDHYDWGLRAVKSVLYIAGALKRGDPDVPERKVLMRALRDTNLAKLSKDDVYVFMGLIRSLFPNLEAPKKDKPDLSEALHVTCKSMGNFPGDNNIFILKCLQYEEILHVRHSVFILGAAGSGKTQCWKCLQLALAKMGDKCVANALNPKAITSNELYGFIHPQTKEWRDGILSNIFRQFALESKTRKNSKWIVLDGIIDAEWIESMNTVMDDNKMLTLVSNERIPLTSSMRLIFEISHMRNASPATVSRGGVVFINESDLGYGPFKDKWLATRDQKEAVHLDVLFERFVVPTMEYYRRTGKPIVQIMDIAIVQTICFLLEGLLKDLKDKSADVYERFFTYATVWAFGGPLPSDGRIDQRLQFSNWWRKEYPLNRVGDGMTVFDYFIDVADKYEFKPWSTLVKPFKPEIEGIERLSSATVMTADTVRMRELMNLLVDNAKPVMLVGTAGTGKTNLIMAKLRALDSHHTIFRTIAFNARTGSASLQGVMEQSLEKRSGRQFGPIQRKKLVFFMDDMNMPNPDKYGTQDAIALLQQHVNYGFWYDRIKSTQKEIVDVRYVGAMNPKSGTFSILDRLLRHYAVFSTNMPDRNDLTTIYGQILNAHFNRGFTRDVSAVTEALTTATIELHLRVTKEFLPTAILFHYQWNMRELFNICQGLCNSTPKLHQDAGTIVRLWTHECQRTFRDRMPRESDISRFDEIMTTVRAACFPDLTSSGQLNSQDNWAPFRTTKDGEENVYDACDAEFLETFLLRKLDDYNSTFAVMDLVLFQQAMEHVCRIARITANPRGNALLVGVGGSGKQSLARLASYINGLDIFQIQVTSSYGIVNFRTDCQELYKKTGLKSAPFSFIMTDQQIVSMDMLVYINDMLSSGNVPELFVGDERDAIIGSIMGEVKQSGHPEYSNPDVCWEFFIDKVRSNLHIVLCMSPVGQRFSLWCRQFPALANTTVIDWFHPWPQKALKSVAKKFLAQVEFDGGDTTATNIAEFMAECHDAITDTSDAFFAATKRRCYTTPKSFLELIQLYIQLLGKKRNAVDKSIERLVTGIDKIKDAAIQVSELQVVLQEESVEVNEAREKTNRLMEHVGREKSIVEEQSSLAAAEEAKTNKMVAEVEAFAADCARDLAAAQPLVDEALAALNTLDKNSLTELKSMARPPEDVVMVCAAVKCLTSPSNKIPPLKSRDWSTCKSMMGNVNQWMKDLLTFDQNNIPQPCIDAIQVYIANPGFDPTSVVSKSFAASGLCKWVIGMNAFHVVRCDVRPKEERLAEAQERLNTSKNALKKVQDRVADLKRKLGALMDQYNDAVATSASIEAKAEKTKMKMQLAERLVGGLADEKIRWSNTIDVLRNKHKLLVGDVLLAAAFVSYIGPFDRNFRDRIVKNDWMVRIKEKEIVHTAGLNIVMDVLTTEAEVASWQNEGLPSDAVSTQNGATMLNCSRWPLMIDPQLQGIRWIRSREERNGLVVLQPGQKGWLEKLAKCIEGGSPCVLEGCGDTLDPVLDNVLGRVTFRRGTRQLMRLGSHDVEVNPSFRFFLQTKLSNPVYTPEVNAQTTVINFTVTEVGLEDQLLAVVVNQERRDLEDTRVALLRQMNTMTIELQECEDGLLMELSNAQGDILENISLVENLERTKKKAVAINLSMAEAQTTQTKISVSRRTYQPVAERGALLFFQLDQLGKIDHMYQYSLEAFMVVLNKALIKAEHPEDKNDVNRRVELVIKSITESVFAYVARGLFERHKLIFSSLLAFTILLKRGELDRRQLDFLLIGKKKTGALDRPESVRDWCPEPAWAAVCALAEVEGTVPAFSTLPQDMSDSNRWRLWCDTEKPEDERLPADWKSLGSFQKLMILRCLRPDRLTNALSQYVAQSLGKFYVSDQAVDVSVSYHDGSTTTPLFFILSPGVDPIKQVEALGAKMGFTYDNEKLHNVSLGQGQEIVAERALQKCFEEGGWCMLNNVHLVERWLRELEKRMDVYAEVYLKMSQVEKRKAERRNARRQAWLAEKKIAAASAEEGDDSAAAAAKQMETSADAEANDTSVEQPKDEEGAAENQADAEPNFDSDDEEENNDGSIRGSKDFRIFLSAEPSPTIPIGILQRSVKLTSEPPTGIQQNIKRALTNFVDEPWERSSKPTEVRAVVFTMCFFHAVVVERKKFGPQGWNRVYPFNVGDLTTCIDVLGNYVEDRARIPWEDLRYVFGEIMYGGHITDDWDRVLCMAYLQQWIVAEVVDGVELAPTFAVPPPSTYAEYEAYIDDYCPAESPVLYGLHPNAEINFRTAEADNLFRIISDLQPKQSSGEAGETPAEIVRIKVQELLERLPEAFGLIDISERLDEDRTPPQHVFYQECERMNALTAVVRTTLIELSLGLKGELSMSAPMQRLFDELLVDRVPEAWSKVSFASLRPLASWFEHLQLRNQQLSDWTGELATPKITMLSYFFNPMSLLTAIMQHTSITNSYDLDQMALICDVTKKTPEQIESAARDACHVYGVVMEGARWDTAQGCIEDSRMKELYPRLPVITIRSLPLAKVDRRDQYECPLYKTQTRGPTFVVGLFLRTKHPARKWTIAGVGCLLDVVE